MPEVAQATITVTPVLQGAQQSLTEQMTEAANPAGEKAGKAAGKSMGEAVSKSMGKAGTTMTKAVTGPIVAAGTAAVASWKDVDAGLDIIVEKTGASGEGFEQMQSIMQNIATTIPTDFATAGEAIGEVNTRFGLTGESLEKLSTQFIKFAKINGTDVTGSVDTVQKALSAFGLSADSAEGILDALTATGQATGASVDTLANGLVQNATAFQEMGLSAEQSIVMMGQLETSGANSETVMQGLRKALKNAAEDGVSLDDALTGLQDAILNGEDGMDGLTKAYELFGKSGDQIYGAVKNGTIDFTNLGSAASDTGGTVSEAFEGTLSPMEDFQTTLNELKILGADIVTVAGPMLTDFAQSASTAIKDLSDSWNELSPEMQETILKVAGIAAVAGPLLVIGGKVIGGISTIAGGIGGLTSMIGGLGGAASAAAPPVQAAGGSFSTMAGGALKMVAAAGALLITAAAIWVLADAAIRISEAGTPAIAVLGGMAVGIAALMGVAALCAPALTAGAVGLVAFGAAMVGIGAGVALACAGITAVTIAVAALVEVISSNAENINSIVSNVGETAEGVITTISDGITQVIDAISGGIEGVLGSVADIFDSMGEAALNAGTGFEKLAGAVINLVSNTGVLDLAATLGATAEGVKKVNSAADGAGSAAGKVSNLSRSLKSMDIAAQSASKKIDVFGTSTKSAVAKADGAVGSSKMADSMSKLMDDTLREAKSGLSDIETAFSSTVLDFEQHIKVPHFSMSGSFNAETGSTPTVSTNWYDKATNIPYLFRNATLFGAGEKHDEILYGKENLLNDIREASGGGRNVTINVTVNGADSPEQWATRLVRQMELEVRTA
jgi:phage-related minor tail protein